MKIFKYHLTLDGRIKMPIGANPLSVGLDTSGTPSIWCAVDDLSPMRWHEVTIAVTGGELPVRTAVFVGTFVKGDFIGHVFFNPNYSVV